MKRRKFVKYSAMTLGAMSALEFVSCKNGDGNYNIKNAIQNIDISGMDLEEMTILELQEKYASGEFTIEKVVAYYLDRIEKIDVLGPALNSVIYVNPNALERARELDAERRSGRNLSKMHGVPVMLKDNINTHDMPTTAGSKALANSIPPEDSFVASNLRKSGAIILAKTNLSEWANFRGKNSTSGWSALGGLTKNPYVLKNNTCGSSAGSGAAVAANLCMVAIGTETNGSIVCPAQTNGIVGFKTSLNLVNPGGIIPIAKTQDVAGPMARTVSDAALCLGAMIEKENVLLWGAGRPPIIFTEYGQFLRDNKFEEKRIGLWTGSMGFDDDVDALMNKAVEQMTNAGATIIEIEKISEVNVREESFEVMLYEYKDGLNNYFKSLGPEAKIKSLDELIEFNKNDPDELKYFGQEYLEMANAKGDLETQEYKDAKNKMFYEIRFKGIDKLMRENKLHAIIAPTGSPAWETDLENGDTFKGGSSSPAAQAGYPSITVPMGFVGELPVGITFFSRAYSEPILIEIAFAYEQMTNHRRKPKFL